MDDLSKVLKYVEEKEAEYIKLSGYQKSNKVRHDLLLSKALAYQNVKLFIEALEASYGT